MKRAFPQNPKSVSNPFTDIPMDGVGQDLSGNSSRFKTSAAMLGLALSVGASSTFWARPGEAVGAVIPQDALALASTSSSEGFPAATSAPSGVAPVFHTVKAGDTFWEIAAAHQVDVEDIKTANGIAPGELLKVGQVLRVPAERQFKVSSQEVAVEPVEAPEVAMSPSVVELQAGDGLAPEKREVPMANQEASLSADAIDASEAVPQVPGSQLSSLLSSDGPVVESTPATDSDSLAVSEPVVPAPEWSNRSVATAIQSENIGPLEAAAAEDEAVVDSSDELSSSSTKPLPMAALPEELSRQQAADIPVEPLSAYEVRPGDTIWTIASAYGISPDKLLDQNPSLSDPDVIRAGQSLQVPSQSASPVQQPTAVVSEPRSIEQSDEPDYLARIRRVAAEPMDREQLYSWIQASQQRSAQADAEVDVADETSEAAIAKTSPVSEQGAPAVAPEAAPTEGQDPHMASLISEVREMQRRQASEVAVLSPLATTDTSNLSDEEPVNPEFAPVGEEARSSVAEQQSQLMAAAPLSSEAYMPSPVVPVGETVSPDLPLLPQPSEFLPEAPNRFDGYIWPAQGVLTSGYGWRWGRMHHGVDVAGPVGTPIFAAASGVVVRAGWNSGGYGNLVDIRHPDGSLTRYAHNSRLSVRAGQEVRQGQQIAEMGSTGYSTGPHLHFEIHLPNSGTVNPIAHLPNR